MSIITVILILVIIFGNFLQFSSPAPFEVTGFKCFKPNKTICANNFCSLTKVRRGINRINMYCYFQIPVTTLSVNLILFKKEGNIYKKWFVNIEEDMCRLFGGTAFSSVLSKITGDLANYANFVHPCPFFGNFSLYNYPLDLSFIPTVLPKGQFRINTIAKSSTDKIIYLVANIFFTLK